MSNTQQVVITNEFLSSFLSHDVGADTHKLKTDSCGFIAEKYGHDLSAYDLHVVENTDSQCHLTLPYYDAVGSVQASNITDGNVGGVAGGEVAVGVAVTLGIAAVIGAGGIGIATLIGLDIHNNIERNGGK